MKKTNLLIALKKGADLPRMKNDLKFWQNELSKCQKGTTAFDNAKKQVNRLETQINAIEKGLQVGIPDNLNFSLMYEDRKAIIRFFEEKRLSKIAQPIAAKAISVEEENAKQQDAAQKFANNLEQHLVNLKSRQALAITMDKNQSPADSIGNWFVDFEKNLKILFEDPDIEKSRFVASGKRKNKRTFNKDARCILSFFHLLERACFKRYASSMYFRVYSSYLKFRFLNTERTGYIEKIR
ncbi:MAG: hypothetical protein LBT05_12310 [Planctomycetaceae bacterium]|jgi:hypothetical protein|nr:hypothetical protein [Planctomycetaceae bacterium]